MKRIEDIKEFEDIDTYYEITNIVAEVFQDRVETHKHLVTANKEIERLNKIINELERYINKLEVKIFDASTLQDKLQELKGSDKYE